MEAMENGNDYIKPVKALATKEIFAVLMIITISNEVVILPVGGGYDSSISRTIDEIAQKYPNCKMKLYEENYNAYEKYFKNAINKENYIW